MHQVYHILKIKSKSFAAGIKRILYWEQKGNRSRHLRFGNDSHSPDNFLFEKLMLKCSYLLKKAIAYECPEF